MLTMAATTNCTTAAVALNAVWQLCSCGWVVGGLHWGMGRVSVLAHDNPSEEPGSMGSRKGRGWGDDCVRDTGKVSVNSHLMQDTRKV